MTGYEQIWGVAEDNFGIITSARARELGVSKQSMVAMAKSGRLVRLGHGVYQLAHHVPGPNDVYAVPVAVAGEANPSVVYVGTPHRVRRHFPEGYLLKQNAPCEPVEYEGYEGIKCQPLVDALIAAKKDGEVEADRIEAAAYAANEKGLISDEECSKFKSQP